MNVYISILKLLLSSDLYNKYFSSIDLKAVEKPYPELYRLYSVLPSLHKEQKEYTPLDLKIVFQTSYPKADPVYYDKVFQDLVEDQADPKHVEQLIRSLTERTKALHLAKLAIRVSEGLDPLQELKNQVEAVEIQSAAGVEDWRQYIVSDNISDLLNQTFKVKGLRWRLDSMNRALGSLRKGDFGFLFARPETGKTTLIASEMSFMADQLREEDGPIVWFNNEEVGGKVQIRCTQAALGLTADEVRRRDAEDAKKLQQEYTEKTHGKLLVFDKKPMTKALVEEVCKALKPSVIIFDQIDKIQGFQADRNDLELKELYGWARELAAEYGPVIAVCQAGGTGENKQWLTMNDVDSSKTSKQGEADWILGIGFVHDPGKEYVRYFHLSKNKLFGDEDTDPGMRHGKWSCFLVPEVAHYKDFNNDGTIS